MSEIIHLLYGCDYMKKKHNLNVILFHGLSYKKIIEFWKIMILFKKNRFNFIQQNMNYLRNWWVKNALFN